VIKGNSFRIPLKPLGDREAGIDVGVNNLLAVYVEDGSALLVSGRPFKSISFYWKDIISSYQSMLSIYGFKSSKRLRRMFKRGGGGRSDIIISTGL
jgi:putative transposase